MQSRTVSWTQETLVKERVMKQPIWIINSTLFVLLLIVFFFIYFSRVSLPERTDIEPALYSKLKKERTIQVNIAQIYEADLFGTYREAKKPVEEPLVPEFPELPAPQPIEVPALPKPQFLEPLDITLRGIFVVSTDSSKNRAIIMDNQTKKETTYRMGDKIADAQLLRIFGNKVIFLRPNGQQEVVYVRELDAKMDSEYAIPDEWNSVVKSVSDTTFLVDPGVFAHRVQDLSNLIDMLHIITAYKQGKSIGCRMGQLDEKSLGTALGLQAGDIILSIEDIPATNMENRLKIYKAVLGKQENDTVTIQLVRNKEEYTFEYILKEFLPEAGQKITAATEFQIKKLQEEERLNILKQKHEFASTLEDIKKRERQVMRERGKIPTETPTVATEETKKE